MGFRGFCFVLIDYSSFSLSETFQGQYLVDGVAVHAE